MEYNSVKGRLKEVAKVLYTPLPVSGESRELEAARRAKYAIDNMIYSDITKWRNSVSRADNETLTYWLKQCEETLKNKTGKGIDRSK